MISSLFELVGFISFILAAYELSGRVGGLIVLGLVLILVGQALDGAKLPRLRKEKPPEKPKRREEMITNEKLDERQ
jgi:hypothetical protein